jgi:uncharacterized protein (DUF58 family)
MARARLTKVGKLFAGLMLLFYIASVTSQSGLLLLFIGLIGGCFAVNWSFARRNVRHLQVTAPKLVQLVEGEASREPWKIANGSSKHAEGIELLHHGKTLIRLPLVQAKDAVLAIPKLVYEERGVFPNAEVTLTSAAPYELIRATRRLQLPGELLVLPRVYETSAPAGAGLDPISGGKFRGGRRVNNGTHFAGVRAWQSGDSFRQVHWKSTARRDELMVKTFEEELGGRLSIILDCAGGEPRVINNAVRAAASIGVAALLEGCHLELRDSPAEPLHLAPFGDEGELLIRLARSTPEAFPWDVGQLWRKSTLAIVGTRWREAWRPLVEIARAQNRRAFLYLPEGENIPGGVDAEFSRFGPSEIHPAEPALS